jgi:hypothetical protein
MKNSRCHENVELTLHPHVNFITGDNGSGEGPFAVFCGRAGAQLARSAARRRRRVKKITRPRLLARPAPSSQASRPS